jgi:hypothetical protein
LTKTTRNRSVGTSCNKPVDFNRLAASCSLRSVISC